MDDLISRQAAIDRINKQREHLEPNIFPQDKIGDAAYRICAEFIERLPSAQQWILCSERLPEEKKDVLIAFKHNMAVGFWEDILDNGEPVWYANSGDGWTTGTESVDSDGIPIAWMPLPEPFREGGAEECH